MTSNEIDALRARAADLAATAESLRAELARVTGERDEALKWGSPCLAKRQPCGCVVCTCEGDRCLGCGSKSCGTHPVSEIPSPVYEPHPLVARADAAELRALGLEAALYNVHRYIVECAEGGVLDELDDPESGSGATVADIDAALADPGASLDRHDAETRAAALRDENVLRRLLWLRHGCDIVTLYGDDGEMQCGACGIDFRRDAAADIEARFVSFAARTPAAEPERVPCYLCKGTRTVKERVADEDWRDIECPKCAEPERSAADKAAAPAKRAG